MARVTIEDRFFSDPRIDALQHLMGWSRQETIGRIISIWHASQERLLVKVTAKQLGFWGCIFDEQGIEKLVSSLVASEFVDKVGDKFQIRGNQKHVAALKKYQDRGRKGGEATKRKFQKDKNVKNSELPDNALENIEENGGLKAQHTPSTSHAKEGVKPSTSTAQFNSIQFNSIQGNSIQDNTENSKPSRKRDVSVSDHDTELGKKWADWTAGEYSHLKPKPEVYAEAIAKVRKSVGLNDAQLNYLFDFVKADPFWSQNCQSPAGLLKKSQNGMRKIDNILAKIKAKVEPDIKASRWAADLDAKEAELGRSLTLEEQILYAER